MQTQPDEGAVDLRRRHERAGADDSQFVNHGSRLRQQRKRAVLGVSGPGGQAVDHLALQEKGGALRARVRMQNPIEDRRSDLVGQIPANQGPVCDRAPIEVESVANLDRKPFAGEAKAERRSPLRIDFEGEDLRPGREQLCGEDPSTWTDLDDLSRRSGRRDAKPSRRALSEWTRKEKIEQRSA